MNQIVLNLRLHDFLVGGEGWGSKAGAVVRRKLQQRLDTRSPAKLVRVSMAGIRKLDVSFVRASLLSLIEERLGQCAVCLVDLTDEDVRANVVAAASGSTVPVTLWSGAAVEVAGPRLGRRMQEALLFAWERSEVRAADYARHQQVPISAASNLFRELARRGYLIRLAGSSASGGPEFVYSRIG